MMMTWWDRGVSHAHFGGIAVYHMLTATAEKHQQKNLDAMLEQLSEYVASECKRAVDVGGYLERIHIQYLELIKTKEALPVLHSRILPRVLGKLSEGRHVGSERMDCAEWQKVGDKASEWQTLHEDDATKVSWKEVYLDLASTYEHVLTHCAKSHGGDPTGPAGRSVRFPTGVGFMNMGIEELEVGCDEQALGFAVQYESTFGKPKKNPIFPASKHAFFLEVATALRFSKRKSRSRAQT